MFNLLLLFGALAAFLINDPLLAFEKLVLETKRIYIEDFPEAWNPSMIKVDQGYLMSFRYTPDVESQGWISYIGVVLLDEEFNPISKPQLLRTRLKNSKTPSQSEDARIFKFKDRMFLIYNDNVDIIYPATWQRRDMFMAELFYTDHQFILGPPLKLIYEEKYQSRFWQKNWVPFEKDGALLMIYSINPHEILYPNLATGTCYSVYETSAEIQWDFGAFLKGSTPPMLVDAEYLAFFHTGIVTSSQSSWGLDLWHYFMGAYTFSAEPPYEITHITPVPIIAENFYTPSKYAKRVIYPGGFVVSDSVIYLTYGKDDQEIWIATIDKAVLKNSMVPVEPSVKALKTRRSQTSQDAH
jgi:predicted GH43/DUF377 family glycosyl hydrolase